MISVVSLAIVLLIPPQSSEALRVLAEDAFVPQTWELFVWAIFGGILIIVMFNSLNVAYSRYTTSDKQSEFSNAHRVVAAFAVAGPFFINGFAFQRIEQLRTTAWLLFPLGFIFAAMTVVAFGWRPLARSKSIAKPRISNAWLANWTSSPVIRSLLAMGVNLTRPFNVWVRFCLLFVIVTGLIILSDWFTPSAPIYLTIAVTLVLSVLTALSLASSRSHFSFIAILFLWWIALDFFDRNDNHQIRTVDVTAIASEEQHRPREVSATLETWLLDRCIAIPGHSLREDCVKPENQPNSNVPYPIIVVAAEGGGMRAAYFTDLVLQELRKRSEEFEKHLFLIVGVSGGSVGATAYAAALHAGLPRPTDARTAPDVLALHEDFLSPVIRALLPGDLIAHLWPFTDLSGWDRAGSLEKAFSNAFIREKIGTSLHEIPFQAIYPDQKHNVPALMLMTTDVATGHRMAVSHVTMPDPPKPHYDGTCRQRGNSGPGTQAKDLTPRLWTFSEEMKDHDLPLDTAAILSARFPVVSSAGTLPSCIGSPRRYVDGGYFENSGVTTVLDVIAAIRQKIAAANVKLIVLRITNSRAYDGEDGTFVPEGAFNEILSPVRALLHTRQARAELAVESLTRLVAAEQTRCDRAKAVEEFLKTHPDEQGSLEKARDTCLHLETALIALGPQGPTEAKVAIPLGWWLSDQARHQMEYQLTDKNNKPVLEDVTTQVNQSAP